MNNKIYFYQMLRNKINKIYNICYVYNKRELLRNFPNKKAN